MNRVDNLKKVIRNLTFVILAITSVIIVLFIIHAIKVQNYNEEWRVVTPDTTATQVVVDIHPRGGVTDSWVKAETGLGMTLNAKIYDLTVTNNTHTYVEDWYLRIDLNDTCFLNNGWCGTFEVHQFDEHGQESSQTVDLRNYDINDLTLKYHQAGQDLLIPLVSGDYMIYHPDSSTDSGELPIKGTTDLSGSAVCGIIMYSRTGNIDFSDYELAYRLHMSVWDGTQGRLFIIAAAVIALSLIILGTVFLASVRFEEKIISQSRTITDALKICYSIADSMDYHSKGHSERVAEYSRMIAEKLGMDKSDCDVVYNAALLHNIGNYTVNGQLLRKNGKLTSTEFAEVKAHTLSGYEILKDIENIPQAAEAALYHHERFDGTGYPHGKKEDEIPLIARIVAVADAFDAMSIDRPYRNKLMHDQIREEFIKNRGTQFDPAIVTAFLDIMGERNL
ncbi:MAG: HD-GYP domain-containing protein [Lachnospiraceae bacterium]|nr:HD-GYP domain-containing protein [Lachnospiraceae bacterium]